jgi:hypothetical protein
MTASRQKLQMEATESAKKYERTSTAEQLLSAEHI